MWMKIIMKLSMMRLLNQRNVKNEERDIWMRVKMKRKKSKCEVNQMSAIDIEDIQFLSIQIGKLMMMRMKWMNRFNILRIWNKNINEKKIKKRNEKRKRRERK